MMTGSRRHKSASLRVAVPECLDDDLRAGVREIVSLQSAVQGQHHASELMQHVCAEADHKRMVLMVIPDAYAAGLDNAGLCAFYAKHGFEVIQLEPVVLMSRAVRH